MATRGAPDPERDWRRTGETWPAPLTVGVISDTHLYPEPRGRDLPATLLDELARAAPGLILHAGDILAPWVLDRLGELAPVLAVRGNGDPADLFPELPLARIVTVGAHRLGLTHGHLGRGATTPLRAYNTFAGADPPVACVAFGHSHQPLGKLHRGVLLFNPGSPTDRRRQPYYSFGLLRVAETIEPELVCFL